MNANEEREIIGIIANAPWPGSISADALKIYRMAIGDLEFDPSMQAVKLLVRTSQYRPTPSEFRETVAKICLPSVPEMDEAIWQANQFFDYQRNCAFINGSGYRPQRPDVHPMVEAVCSVMGDNSHGSWVAIFTKSYNQSIQDRIDRFVAADHSQTEEAN